MSNFKFCPECGFKFDREYKFCPECGYKLDGGGNKESLFDFSDDTADYGEYGGFSDMVKAKQNAGEKDKQSKLKNLSIFDYEEHLDGTYSIKKLNDTSALTIVVPEGVTSIMPEAFMSSGIISATLPEGLVQIGDRAFKGCKNLMSINIPSSLIIMGDEVFADCESLNISLPKTIKKVGKDVLKNTIPDIKRKQEEARKTRMEELRMAAKRADEAARKMKEDFEKASGLYYEKKYDEAFPIFKRLAEDDNASAQNFLGICYEYGRGVDKDIQKAVSWYQKSADQGNVYAIRNIGLCYEYGTGFSKDYSKALAWYKKSIACGHKKAAEDVKRVEETMRKEEEKLKKRQAGKSTH